MSDKKKPLSILLVIDSLGSGGAQRQMVWLAIGLAKRGHDVSLFTYNPKIDHFKRELDDNNIEVLEADKRYRFDIRPVLVLRRIIATRRFNCVISFMDTPNIYTVLASRGNRHTKVLVSERFIFPDGRLTIGVWLRYQFYRFADIVTVNSYHQRDRILDAFPWSQRKLHAIWNGVDLSKYAPVRQHDDSKQVNIRLIAVATVVEWKNAYNLIKALALSKAEGAKYVIDWAGRIPQTKTGRKEYERCQKLIDELDLRDEWHWLGVCEDMHRLYPTYNALVHPSFKEGLPNAICEALATGLPVIAGDVCDHPVLIQDSVSGFLFDPADPQSIANALLKFSRQSDAERSEMSREARRTAETRLGFDTLVDEYIRVVYDCCS